jgi:hypothetical protein
MRAQALICRIELNRDLPSLASLLVPLQPG